MSMMKIKTISASLLLFCSTIAYSCDYPGLENVYTLQPGQTQTVQWNFTDCWYGITSFTIYVTQPRNKNGYAAALPPNTPLTMTVVNVTTKETYVGSSHVVAFSDNCCGDLIVLNLTNTGKKPLSVLVSTSANLGG